MTEGGSATCQATELGGTCWGGGGSSRTRGAGKRAGDGSLPGSGAPAPRSAAQKAGKQPVLFPGTPKVSACAAPFPRSGVHLAQVRLSPTGPFLRRRPAALRDPGGDGRLHGCVDRAAVAPGGRVPCRLGTLPSTFGPKASTGNPNNVRRHHGSSGVRGGTGSTGVPPNSSHSQTLECDLL